MQNWKNYKIIFSDFDGTLVGRDFQPTIELKNAISKWQNSGKIFSIVTGKPYAGVLEKAIYYLGITGPIIVNGGSLIIDPQTRKTTIANYFHPMEISVIIEKLLTMKLLFEIRTDNNNYASHLKLIKLKPYRQFENMTNMKFNNVVFIRIHTDELSPSVSDYVLKTLEQKFPNTHIVSANSPYSKGIEITSKYTSKHTAVLKTLKLLKIDPSDTIAIGDEMNDYPLLTACGYKVVMENGNKDLKAIADEIIPSYSENGVAKFINKVLLG